MANDLISRAIVAHSALLHCYNDRGCVSCPMYDECEGDASMIMLYAAKSLAEMIHQYEVDAEQREG